jgi:hypothetical protein
MLLQKLFATITIILSTSIFTNISAQNDSTSIKNEESEKAIIESLFLNNFIFNRPDSDFIDMEDGKGYESVSRKAKITYMHIPADYNSVKQDFFKPNRDSSSIFVDTVNHIKSDRQAFSFITEEIAPKESGEENYIFIFTIVSLDKKTTIAIIGAIPKSQDAYLREKFFASALSVKRR